MFRLQKVARSACREYCTVAFLVGIIGSTIGNNNTNNDSSSFSMCTPPGIPSGVDPGSSRVGDVGNKVVYTPDQVREMDGTDGKPFWASYRGEVFDLTHFLAAHPGGSLIEQTAGSDVEPFWNKWAIHFESKKVKAVLKECKIGDLTVCQRNTSTEYACDPARAPQRLHHDFCCIEPAASQTHPHILQQHFLTPNEALYIRNHAPVPSHLAADTHEVSFSLLSCSRAGATPQSRIVKTRLSLTELRDRFPCIDIVSVLQCAGNRQIDDYNKLGKNGFSGTVFQSLESGMVGNAVWTGVRLDALLPALFPAECAEEAVSPGSWHVVFSGADEYESSTPLTLLLLPATDALLALAVNGEALPPDHGHPVRALLPGLAGARSVKWLEGVALSRTPSKGPWNNHYYRDSRGGQIQRLPLNSILFSPGPGAVVQLREDGTGSVSVQGVAYSGGENTSISVVDVSADGGRSWTRARLLWEEREEQAGAALRGSAGEHSWVRFVAEVPVQLDVDVDVDVDTSEASAGGGQRRRIIVLSRATDSRGKVQPEASSGGQRSYLYDGWGTASLSAMIQPHASAPVPLPAPPPVSCAQSSSLVSIKP